MGAVAGLCSYNEENCCFVKGRNISNEGATIGFSRSRLHHLVVSKERKLKMKRVTERTEVKKEVKEEKKN
jgi:hypothetical protein